MMKKVVQWSLLFVSVLMAGCSITSTSPYVPPIPIPLHIEATNDINMFNDDQARPVVVRVYQLLDVGNFGKADFVSLYSSDAAILGDAMVEARTLNPVLPGDNSEQTLELQQQTKFIAVFVEFSEYESATSKAYIPVIEKPEDHPVYIKITRNSVEISQPETPTWWQY